MLKIKLLLVFSFIVALTACGGGSGGGSSSGLSVGTFSDAGLVSGLQYQTATQSGITDVNGKFNYLPGETVSFKIGNIALGQAVAGPALNTFDLVGIAPPLKGLGVTNNIPNGRLFRQAINISVFLQTLDADANPKNGIAIPTQAIELAANTTLNFNQQLWQFPRSFPLKQFMARSRAAGLWGGTRAITLSGYAVNRLYAGLSLAPSLFATSRSESFTSSGAIDSSSTYIYDANGNQIESKYFNGSDVLQSRYTSIFDANGNQIESKSFNGSDVLQWRYTSTFDANGNQIESKYFNGGDVLQSRYTSTFDANGNQIESKYFNGSDVLQWRSAYTYDANGNQIESKEFNGSDVLQWRYTSTFDANGNQIESKSFNGSDVLQSRYTSTFDANGYQIESKEFNGSDVLQSRYTSTFDANGNQIESKSFNGSDVLQSRTLHVVSPISGWVNILGFGFFGPS